MSSISPLIPKFFKLRFVKITIPFLFAIIFCSLIMPAFNAFGLQGTGCSSSLTSVIDANYQGPIVVDAYWTEQGQSVANGTQSNPTKKEIGPGEGPSVLAVILENRGSQTLGSITGYLNIPSGFAPTGESRIPQLLAQGSPAIRNSPTGQAQNNPALASYYGTVGSGGTFALYFNVNVLKNAKVGTFGATLVANYYIVNQVGQCASALLDVPFVLPGKVILDATSTPEVAPQRNDPLVITIENKGSADATGVVATITNLGTSKGGSSGGSSGSVVISSSSTQVVNLGPNTFNLGTIPANSKTQIQTTVYPSSAAGGSTQNVSIQINYENAWGKAASTVLNTGLVISPNPPESLSLSYLGNTTTPVITAGNLDDLNFAVANNSTDPMTDAIISLVPQSTSVSIVGPSTWTILNLQSGDRQVLSTKVFAATTLINTPTSFTLTANYVTKGTSQTNSMTLGTFVVGNIKLQLYSLSVNSAGSPSLSGNLLNQGSTTGLYTTIDLARSPLLTAIREARLANSTNNDTGNQLSSQSAQAAPGGFQGQGGQGGGFQGQGGQGGGFQGQGGQRQSRNMATQQFIGDLTPDSPIPFSIPVNGLGLLHPGMYQVAFRVTYADDLKNFHNVIINGTVNIPSTQSFTGQQSVSIFDQIPIPMVLGVGIAIAAGIAVLIRKKKSANQKLKMMTQSSTDIVSIFDAPLKKEHES
jgi:hypothetical protein